MSIKKLEMSQYLHAIYFKLKLKVFLSTFTTSYQLLPTSYLYTTFFQLKRFSFFQFHNILGQHANILGKYANM